MKAKKASGFNLRLFQLCREDRITFSDPFGGGNQQNQALQPSAAMGFYFSACAS